MRDIPPLSRSLLPCPERENYELGAPGEACVLQGTKPESLGRIPLP